MHCGRGNLLACLFSAVGQLMFQGCWHGPTLGICLLPLPQGFATSSWGALLRGGPATASWACCCLGSWAFRALYGCCGGMATSRCWQEERGRRRGSRRRQAGSDMLCCWQRMASPGLMLVQRRLAAAADKRQQQQRRQQGMQAGRGQAAESARCACPRAPTPQPHPAGMFSAGSASPTGATRSQSAPCAEQTSRRPRWCVCSMPTSDA